MTEPLFRSGDDWTFSLLDQLWEACDEVGKNDLQLDYYRPQIEVVSAEQMLDSYVSVGMPIMYRHWSFGKEFINLYRRYQAGDMGLAYELVINSDPCIAYLMEENNALQQLLVIAHACVGHNSVFKNNYLFKQRTDATAIIDYLNFAKQYVAMCEEKYGHDAVEEILDACHSLQNFGVDLYKRPKKLKPREEEKRALERFEAELQHYDPVFEKTGRDIARRLHGTAEVKKETKRFPEKPQENLLYFIEKNAPLLAPWKRELVRIVRRLAEYFYPQMLTQVVNEGWATFCHYYIVTRLHEQGKLDAGSMIQFYQMHGNVILQVPYNARDRNGRSLYTGLNPYYIGFSIFRDLRRMCEDPTPEDKQYFPTIAGQKDWRSVLRYAMENFKDDTFIAQYLSPKVVRDLKLFWIQDKHHLNDYVTVEAIQDRDSFELLRQKFSERYARSSRVPYITIDQVDMTSNRRCRMTHHPRQEVPLDEAQARHTLDYFTKLWEFPATLKTICYEDEKASERLLTSSGIYGLNKD